MEYIVQGLENIPSYLLNILFIQKFPPQCKKNKDFNEKKPLMEKIVMNLANRKLSQRLNSYDCHIISIEYIAKFKERVTKEEENQRQAHERRRMKQGVLLRKNKEKIWKENEQMVAGQ